MAINRFDTPAQAKFINTYVPLPVEELRNAGLARQATHDKNMDRLDLARSAADNLKYIDNSADETYIKGVQGKLESIADQYLDKDLSDPEIYRSLRSDLRTNVNQNDVREIQESYAAYTSNQKNVADLKRKGLYHEALDSDPSKGYSTADQGVYGYQTESKLDGRAAAEKYFNGLEDNSRIDMDGRRIVSGVSANDIKRVANDNISSFIDSNEGRQTIQIAAARNGEDYANMSTERKEQLALGYLENVGQEYIRRKETPLSDSYTGTSTSKTKTPKELGRIQQGTKGGKLNDDILGLDINDNLFDEEGNVDGSKLQPQVVTSAYTSNRSVAFNNPNAPVYSTPTQDQDKASSALTKKINTIRTMYPELGDLTPQETVQAYREISTNASKFRNSYATMSQAQGEAWGNAISMDLSNRKIEWTDKKGNTKSGSLGDDGRKTILKDLGVNAEELAKSLRGESKEVTVKVKGFDMGDSDIPGAMKLQIFDKNGNEHNVNVSGTNETTQFMQPVTSVRQKMTSMQSGLVAYGKSPDGTTPYGVEIIPSSTLNPATGKYEYTPKLIFGEFSYDPQTGDSEIINGQPVTLDQLADDAMGRMTGQPTLGLDLGNLGSSTNVQ